MARSGNVRCAAGRFADIGSASNVQDQGVTETLGRGVATTKQTVHIARRHRSSQRTSTSEPIFVAARQSLGRFRTILNVPILQGR